MAYSTLQIAGGLLAVYIAYKLVRSILDWNTERQWNSTHGTKRPHHVTNYLPFGLDRFFTLLDNASRELAPEFSRSMYERRNVDTFSSSGFGETAVQTREPRNVQAILATQFKEFSLGSTRYGNFFPLLGNGIFTLDGKGWEHSRALLRPQFSREQISHLQSLEDHIQTMIKRIPVDGTPIDLQQLFFKLTLDTATEFLFGESMGSLVDKINSGISDSSDDGGMGFAEAFNKSQDFLLQRARLRAFYWLWSPKEFKESNKICKDLIDHYVRKAIHANQESLVTDEKAGRKQKYVFLDALAQESQDPILLRDQSMNILLAGRDTTASLLGWVFYMLGRNPDVMKKLRDIIKADFGDENLTTPLTFEQLKSCTYLRWVVNETLRLYPVVPFNSRTAIKDTTIPTGGGPDGKSPIFIRKGQQVRYSVYAMHRREDIWGEDANFFRPERWGEPRQKAGYGGFEYLPFNGGPRICLGQQFALTEASYTIVKMLQHFDRILLVDFDPDTKMKITLTMCRGGNGTMMKLYKD